MPAHNFIDLTGKVFDRLTVVSRSEKAGKHIKWNCLCSCGKLTEVYGTNLKGGITRSCGCLMEGMGTTHGMSGTKVYTAWRKIIRRCSNPDDISFQRYGGKGIGVCDRWLSSFEDFYADMGDPPTPEHSIERVENNVGYRPENCKWATRVEQANNKSSNVLLTFRGETLTIAQWAERTGLGYQLIWNRNRLGWPPEKMLTSDSGSTVNKLPEATYQGVTLTISQWADKVGMEYEALRARFRRGWSPERALTTPTKKR